MPRRFSTAHPFMKRSVAAVAIAGALAVAPQPVLAEASEETSSVADPAASIKVAPAREVPLPVLQGGPDRSLADFRGKYIVLHFGTSW